MGYYIGIDLGGTNIKAGLLDDAGQTLAKASMPTGTDARPKPVMVAMTKIALRVARQADIKIDQVDAIGIGSPGPIDFERGLVLASPNLKGWKNVPLRDTIARATGRPSVLENDANAAAFGEYWIGAGQNKNITDMVMLTLGTGIGSGLVIGGHVLHGGFGMGGEAGHLIVQPGGRLCGCGQHGCLEAYASASNTARRAVEAIEKGEVSSLTRKLRRGRKTIDAKDVFDAARVGDVLAKRIVDQTCEYLALACVSLCRILDPQMIVLAGGMILAGDFLFEKIRHFFRQHHWTLVPPHAKIVAAQLGNGAGYIGAAAVARDAHRSGKLV